MTTIQESETAEIDAVRVSAVWLWAVRITAALNLLPLFFLAGYVLYEGNVPCTYSRSYWLTLLGTLLCVAALPYCRILWRLRMNDLGELSESLRLAMSWSTFVIIGGGCYLGLEPVFLVVAGGPNLALLMLAVAFHISFRRRVGKASLAWRYRCEVLGYACLTTLVFFVAHSSIHVHRRDTHESAVRALRSIPIVQQQYRRRFPDKGYAGSLRELAEAGYITGSLATGKRGGYRFTLTSGSLDEKGRAGSYTVHARPNEYGSHDGCRSYWLTDAGVIRWTNEDRPATAEDPPID